MNAQDGPTLGSITVLQQCVVCVGEREREGGKEGGREREREQGGSRISQGDTAEFLVSLFID